MTHSSEKPTVVLVHGAWADGSCWNNVILPLQRKGLNVVSASIPLTSLTEDAVVLQRIIARTKGPVILVGHAYGGAVIGAADDVRVKALVYIAALAPDEGETVADVFYRGPSHPEAPQLAPDEYGFIWMPDDGFGRAVAHRASADESAIMAVVQRPINVLCIQEKAPAPGWKTKPSWYLVSEEDRMISPDTQRFMADRMGATVVSHAVDHSPMYQRPKLVVEVIESAVTKAISL